MGLFAAGQVVVLPFPFSDLSRNKYRPVLVLADAGRGVWIACQITSNPYSDPCALTLAEQDFASGRLAHTSYVRPSKLITAHADLMERVVGTVRPDFLNRARDAVIQVIRGGMMQEQYATMLATDRPDQGLMKGDMGAVVMVHASGNAFEVEFVTLASDTLGVLTLTADEVRPISAMDMPQIRVV